jgi:CHAD domain-containing protein
MYAARHGEAFRAATDPPLRRGPQGMLRAPRANAMHMTEPMVRALQGAVEPRIKKLEKRLKKAKAGDPDGVHDSRTELRRVRAELDLMGSTVFDSKATSRLAGRLHALEQALAKARDTDVLLDDLNRYLARRPGDEEGLSELRDRLVKRRDKGAREANLALAGKLPRTVLRELRGLMAAKNVVTLRPPKNPARAAPELVRHFTHAEIWRLYEHLRAYDARLPADVETLHKFRSACRQLRFAIEALADALPAMEPIARELHALQDEIGTVHDHQVALDLLTRWRDKGKLASTPELERYLSHHERARDRLRGRFEARWLGVLGPDFRRRLAEAVELEANAA